MANKCNLIKDILPLYVEDMVSTDTREFVREHLEACEECRAEFGRMRKSVAFIPADTDIVPLKRIKRDLFIKRIQIIFFTAILACVIVVVAFGILTSPKFYPYSDNLLNVADGSDGNIIITFDDKVTGYSFMKEVDNEAGTEVYHINAWTTTWDAYLSNRGRQNTIIPSNGEAKTVIFYAQNDGSEDVLIYGVNDKAQADIVTLPRQILMSYFLLAFLAFAVLAILRFLLRSKQAVVVWFDRAILFPISYIAAQLCTKGINFTTYSTQRDFCIIILIAMLLYFAMLIGKSLSKARKGAS